MSFVVSAGQLESVHRSTVPATYPVGLSRVGAGMHAEYSAIFRAQPSVRTVVSFLARNIAQLGIHVFRRLSDTDRERLTDHPLAVLLGRPCPPELKLTRYRLIERLVCDLGIYDEAYWVKVTSGPGVPHALVPIPPPLMIPQGRSWLMTDGWRINGTNAPIDLDPDSVVHFRGYNPDDTRSGVSPMETLRELLIEAYEANRARQEMWRNGSRTSGIIERPATAPPWSENARERFKESWRAGYTRDGDDVGGSPILEDGMVYKPSGLDPKAAQYIEARKLTREEVAAAYFVPPPMVGILEHATFSNIVEQHKNLYQDTLGPWLTMIAEDIALQLLSDFADTDGVYVEFNIAEKLQGSFEAQAAALQTLVGGPVMTRNEGRGRLNLSALEGGDELITPLNVTEGGLASPRDTAPSTAPDAQSDAAAAA